MFWRRPDTVLFEAIGSSSPLEVAVILLRGTPLRDVRYHLICLDFFKPVLKLSRAFPTLSVWPNIVTFLSGLFFNNSLSSDAYATSSLSSIKSVLYTAGKIPR